MSTDPHPVTHRPAHALDALDHVRAAVAGRRLAVFLDYDGTLTPIVERPELAVLAPAMRHALVDLSRAHTTAIVSGRALDEVRALVAIDGIAYAGNHGLEILLPDGSRHEHAAGHLDALAGTARRLERELADLDGVRVEDKRHSLSVHYRLAEPEAVPVVAERVDRAVRETAGLRRRHGKKVYEIRPDVEWDKGRAVLWLQESLGLDRASTVPVYVGDDDTDEDAFRAIGAGGIGVRVVQDAGRTQGQPAGETAGGTAARYWLRDPAEVQRLIQILTAVRT